MLGHHLTAWRNVPTKMHSTSKSTNQSFFALVQAHVVGPAQSVLAAMTTPSPGVTAPNYETVHPGQPGKTSREDWSPLMASPSASTGRCQVDVCPRAILTGTGVLDVEKATTGLKLALVQRRLKALSPYHHEAWAAELSHLGLVGRYPSPVQGLAGGFNLGILCILHTHAPPNHHSVKSLNHVYKSIVNNEFAAGHYISPFSCAQLEDTIGPFQTSPQSLVLKTSKPGKYRAVHDFSHPHTPSPKLASVNSHI